MVVFMYAYWHDHRFKDKTGGPIKVWELSDNLTKMGHTVFLFVPRIGFPELQTSAKVRAVPFIDLPAIRFISFQMSAFFFSIFVLLFRQRPQIIYVRLMPSFLPTFFGKLFRIPVILEINDSPHRGYKNTRSVLKRFLLHFMDRVNYRLSDYILPVTAKIANDLHNIEHVSREKMSVVQSGTNTQMFYPLDKISCRKTIGLPTDCFVVGFIGNFFSHQGIDILIDSAPMIITEYDNITFLLVGDGPMENIWKEKVNNNNLERYFRFTGYIPYKDVPHYVGAIDVCVAPLMFSSGESSAVKIFDYLASGRPVILSDIANTGEQFLESNAVILIKPEDPSELARSVKQLLSDPGRREKMGENGRQFILANYDRVKLAQNIADLCQGMVN
jgi:glycosyltransferase involved in cell wall biosynthesis